MFHKYTVKGSLTAEPDIHTNVRNRLIGPVKQLGGIFQPDFIQILIEIPMEGSGKNSGQRIWTDSEIMRHLRQC